MENARYNYKHCFHSSVSAIGEYELTLQQCNSRPTREGLLQIATFTSGRAVVQHLKFIMSASEWHNITLPISLSLSLILSLTLSITVEVYSYSGL